MRRSKLVMCVLLAGTTLGCAKIKEALDKRRNRTRAPATQTATQDTTKKPATPATPGAAPTTPATPVEVQPPPKPVPAPTRATRPATPVLHDEPYNSPDTGTIAPGMTQRDVVALWGPPSAVRHASSFTYLHYPNGCERSCGTDDVVILQNDQVVDAIVRWAGHGYSGQSTSPPGRTPMPTLQ